MNDFSMGFDPHALEALVRMAGFEALLAPEITEALTEGGQLLTEAAQAKTWEVFDNPSGRLADSIYPWLASPSQMEVRAGVPYARRREKGFSGMTDSLGRFYANDPAKPFFAPTLSEQRDEVRALAAEAVQRTLARLGGR